MKIALYDNLALPPITLIPTSDNGGTVRIVSPIPSATYLTLSEIFRGPQGPQGPQGPAGTGATAYSEDLTPLIDGSTQNFALAQTPALDSLLLFLNGLFLDSGDYTLTANTVAMTYPTHVGDKLRAVYQV